MFYELKDGLEVISLAERKPDVLTYGILTLKEVKEVNAEHFGFTPITLYEIGKSSAVHTINKMDSYFGYCFGLFHILNKNQTKEEQMPIGMYISRHFVLVICDDEAYEKRFYDVVDKMNPNSYCLERLLTTLMDAIVYPVHAQLEALELEINRLDEVIMNNKTEGIHRKISDVRKDILLLSHYFEQLLDICEELLEDENSLFHEERLHHIRIFSDRVSRMSDHVRLLRDYCVQVREEYQAQVDLNLNQIMYVFTIVTVIFLPLTLIVGWYGMNFTTMPELGWQFGYLFVILLSVASIVVCLWYFSKKRLLKK